jgi:hypothetical protein
MCVNTLSCSVWAISAALGLVLLALAVCTEHRSDISDTPPFAESAWLEVPDCYDAGIAGVYKVDLRDYAIHYSALKNTLRLLPAGGDYGGGVVMLRGKEFNWDISDQDVIGGTIEKGLRGNYESSETGATGTFVRGLVRSGMKIDKKIFRRSYLEYMDILNRERSKKKADINRITRPPTTDGQSSPR